MDTRPVVRPAAALRPGQYAQAGGLSRLKACLRVSGGAEAALGSGRLWRGALRAADEDPTPALGLRRLTAAQAVSVLDQNRGCF
ncbi:MAG: hypothetical protein JXA13_03745 [Anaerolineales bacterium]|nr:hypothetical protein [Anaerolineales bacterium]